MKTLGIIPARGGSKGIPNKNLATLIDKPLIGWTIFEAFKTKKLDDLIVSTDSPEIAHYCSNIGCNVPFIRPAYLATDYTSSGEVALHALRNYNLGTFDYACLLQPTSPLRTWRDIDQAIDLAEQKKSNCVSICRVSEHPYTMYWEKKDSSLEPIIKSKDKPSRRQDYKNAYKLNGAIYIFNVQKFLTDQKFVTDDSIGYIMPRNRSIDIDTITDLKLAEQLLAENLGKK